MPSSRSLLILLLVLPALNVQAAAKPGLWNLTVTVTAEGAAQPYGPYTQNQCFNQNDMRKPEKLLANIGAPDCSYGNVQDRGNRLTFDVQCGGTIPMSGSGNVNYTADTFQGQVDITADLEGLAIATHSQVSGVRTGDCPAGQ
ncbi:MAG TPA: DUF3617 family protein [Methylophilaceae bacterium]|nr:DUF3617 family protein [Methylophilaceae bacterium]